jgi:competence protein ComGC
MTEYTVTIQEVLEHEVVVLASSQAEAYELAHEWAGELQNPKQPKEVIRNHTECVDYQTINITPEEDEDAE